MAISENLTEWLDRKVVDYKENKKVDSAKIYRFRNDYDGGEDTVPDQLDQYIASGAAATADAIVIGMPAYPYNLPEGKTPFGIVSEYLLKKKEKFPELRHLFFGDFTYEECEISWMPQTNPKPILEAFPGLESFVIRGIGLEINPLRHICLKHIGFQTGSIERTIFDQINKCIFPELTHLEVWTGSSMYGWNGTPEDVAKFFDELPFPNLKKLSLLNAENGDDIASHLAGSSLLDRLEELDLSLGTVQNKGAQALIDSGKLNGLKKLKIHHHFMSDEMEKKLVEAAPYADVSRKDAELYDDDDEPYVAVGE